MRKTLIPQSQARANYRLLNYRFDDYQCDAKRTMDMANTDTDKRVMIAALGLAGEAGEVADIIKKHIGHGHDLDPDKLKKELGDVLWYIAFLCHLRGFDLAEIALANIDKLKARYPHGFSHEQSRNRKD